METASTQGSVEYRKAHEVARAYNERLKASDFNSDSLVKIVHEDGGVFLHEGAFLRWYEGKWVFLFSEHHGFEVFAIDDLVTCGQFTREWVKHLEEEEEKKS